MTPTPDPAAARADAQRAAFGMFVQAAQDALNALCAMAQRIAEALFDIVTAWLDWASPVLRRFTARPGRYLVAELGATGLRAPTGRHLAHWRRHTGAKRGRR